MNKQQITDLVVSEIRCCLDIDDVPLGRSIEGLGGNEVDVATIEHGIGDELSIAYLDCHFTEKTKIEDIITAIYEEQK